MSNALKLTANELDSHPYYGSTLADAYREEVSRVWEALQAYRREVATATTDNWRDAARRLAWVKEQELRALLRVRKTQREKWGRT